MRDFTIDLIWTKVQVAVTALGGWFGYFIGGVDGFMTALIILMALDYITGIMCAIVDKKLSSSIGFKGIFKKMLIIMLVGVAHIVDNGYGSNNWTHKNLWERRKHRQGFGWHQSVCKTG